MAPGFYNMEKGILFRHFDFVFKEHHITFYWCFIISNVANVAI